MFSEMSLSVASNWCHSPVEDRKTQPHSRGGSLVLNRFRPAIGWKGSLMALISPRATRWNGPIPSGQCPIVRGPPHRFAGTWRDRSIRCQAGCRRSEADERSRERRSPPPALKVGGGHSRTAVTENGSKPGPRDCQEPPKGIRISGGCRIHPSALCGSAAILVGISACGAQVGTTSSPSASSTPCSQHRASASLWSKTPAERPRLSRRHNGTVRRARRGVVRASTTTGWSVRGSSGSSTSVQSGSFTLEVLHGPDGTWQLTSGTDATC